MVRTGWIMGEVCELQGTSQVRLWAIEIKAL